MVFHDSFYVQYNYRKMLWGKVSKLLLWLTIPICFLLQFPVHEGVVWLVGRVDPVILSEHPMVASVHWLVSVSASMLLSFVLIEHTVRLIERVLSRTYLKTYTVVPVDGGLAVIGYLRDVDRAAVAFRLQKKYPAHVIDNELARANSATMALSPISYDYASREQSQPAEIVSSSS
ncbi:hypothetical protein A6E01_20730 (plasmid) [Vibrio breoganii]|uniref:Uncharacterized protein n=1 Tax=Vibrio breoganii TaxID=553239 RepID=A0AAN0XZR7_9VIBR|nr:hypothetical protein [Vibrio breoganii]ANO35639.1 hypothetical protein A6E01_20730 [Vibrio breoganii]PML19305.1 hypothetical protein BCT84_18700 [Vibrio breoganii]